MGAVTELLARPQPPTAAPRPSGGATIGRITVVALTLTVVLETLRVLLPLEWTVSSDVGLVISAATFPLLFLTPLAAPLLRRIAARPELLAVALLVAARLALQADAPAPFWLAAVATGVTLMAMVPIVAASVGGADGRYVAVYGVVLGLAVDAALRGAYGTWDHAWRPGAGPMLVTVALLGALAVAAGLVLRRGRITQGEPDRGRVPRAAALGLLLAPQILFLQSPGFVGSSGRLSLAWSVAVVVAGGVAALAAGAMALRRPSRVLGVLAGALLAVAVALLPTTTGWQAVLLVLVGQALAAVLLAAVVSGEPVGPRHPGLWRTSVGAAVGLVVSYLALLLYQMYYEHRLPLSNRWLPVAVVAAAVACLSAARGAGPAAAPYVRSLSTRALALAVCGVGALAAGVGLGLAATAAHPTVVTEGRWPLRVMTFNVAGGVTRAGSIDLAAVAERIRTSGAAVVSLQEVYRGWPLAGTVDVGGWLEHELGWQQVWAPAADNQAGNLLLSRLRLSDRRSLSLPRGGGSMDRSATIASVSVEGTTVEVVGTHLQHRNSTGSMRARQQELAVLLRYVGTNPYVVVMGDLNPRNPDLVDLRTLTANGFTTSLNGDRCVAPTSNENCSDYVYVGRGLRQSDTHVVTGSPFDHRPVLSSIVRARP